MGMLGILVYMYFEVGGDLIPDNSRVLAWAEIDNPNPGEFGTYEAFDCVATYKKFEDFSPIDEVAVHSYDGTHEFGWPQLTNKNNIWKKAYKDNEHYYRSQFY